MEFKKSSFLASVQNGLVKSPPISIPENSGRDTAWNPSHSIGISSVYASSTFNRPIKQSTERLVFGTNVKTSREPRLLPPLRGGFA